MADTLTTRGALAETEAHIHACRMAILKDLRDRWPSATVRQRGAILEHLTRPPAQAVARYVAANAALTGADIVGDQGIEASVKEFFDAVLPAAQP